MSYFSIVQYQCQQTTVDNKLRIQFGKDKTKCNFFDTKCRLKVAKVNITHNGIDTEQYWGMAYLGYVLGDTMSVKTVAFKKFVKDQF